MNGLPLTIPEIRTGCKLNFLPRDPSHLGVRNFPRWRPAAILHLIQPELAPFDPPTPKTPSWYQTRTGSDDPLQRYGHPELKYFVRFVVEIVVESKQHYRMSLFRFRIFVSSQFWHVPKLPNTLTDAILESDRNYVVPTLLISGVWFWSRPNSSFQNLNVAEFYFSVKLT